MSQQTAAPAKEAKPAPPKPQRPPVPPVPPEFQADRIMKLDAPSLIRILQDPNSSEFEKSKACMQLALVGDKNAVPALAALLSNPKLSHYARFGLVPIPDPSVDEAFRATLSTAKGTLLVSMIDAIGQRRDTGAVEALKPFVYGSDKDAALAAIASLGMISGPAAPVLLEALQKTSDPLRKEVAAAGLVCAEMFLNRGERQQAMDLYTRLSQPDIPKVVRLAAMHNILAAERH
jgi:hypothetical protein